MMLGTSTAAFVLLLSASSATGADAGPKASSARSTAPIGPTTKAKPTAPIVGPAVRVLPTEKLVRIPAAQRRAATVKPARNAQASAALGALLRQYAEGGSGSKFEKAVGAKMRRRSASKAAATRLASRLANSTPERAARATLKNAAGLAKHAPGMAYLMQAVTLPAEKVSFPSRYRLEATGLAVTKTDDADGGDEVTMFAVIATPTGDDYSLSTVDLGQGLGTSVGTMAVAGEVWNAPAGDAVIVTALVEDDGGNASAAKEEIELLIELAASVAATMPGEDRLAVLQTMVDYTISLDAAGSDPNLAARSVVATRVGKSDWAGMWSGDTTTSVGIPWKVAVPHQLGSGAYELLLNVPSKLPKMKTIRVAAKDFAQVRAHAGELRSLSLRVSIGNRSHEFDLEHFGDSMPPLERKVVDGVKSIGVSGSMKVFHEADDASDGDLPSADDIAVCLRLKEETDRAKRRRLRIRCQRLLEEARRKARKKARKKKRARFETLELDLAAGPSDDYQGRYSTKLDSFVAADNPKASKQSASAPRPAAGAGRRTRTTRGTKAPAATVTLHVSARSR